MGELADVVRNSAREPDQRWRDVDYWEHDIVDFDDAEAVIGLLEGVAVGPAPTEADIEALGELGRLFENAADEVFDYLGDDGGAQLVRILKKVRSAAGEPNADQAMLTACVACAEYGVTDAGPAIAWAIQGGLDAEMPGWWRVFHALVPENPVTPEVLRHMRRIPQGSVGAQYLDTVNYLLSAGFLDAHPYDTDEGRARVAELLEDDNGAPAAAGAIAHLSDSDALLEKALAHPDASVRLKASGAAAAAGDDRAMNAMVEAAQDPATSLDALQILDEFDLLDPVPDYVFSDEFHAKATMASWLQHPNEFGRAPDSIEQVDHRTIYWPPTEDERPFWMFRYTYAPEEGEAETGYGLVGSTTFSLLSTTSDSSVEDVYAYHCCYELIWNDDPRAPEQASAEAGRALLGW